MTARKKTPLASRFLRSVNLEQDLGKHDSLQGYVVTSGVRRALQRVATPGIDGRLNRAITLTGPYGTGKSAFALFCASLLAPRSWKSHEAARALLARHDSQLEKQLFGSTGTTPALLPVMVTGSREPIATAILRGLLRASETLKGPGSLKHGGVIRRYLAAAARGGPVDTREVLNIVATSLAKLSKAKQGFKGVVLVLDELGKLLEYAAAHPNESDVYLLQNLAELAVRSNEPFLLVGVLHQDFSAYVDRLSPAERAEWEKVRGRFDDCAFEEPADEILRLVASARAAASASSSQNRSPSRQVRSARVGKTNVDTFIQNAVKFDLAPPNVTRAECSELLRQCLPLHPLVSVLLGPLFRKLAQNERSVFSFLTSDEPNGLRDFISKGEGKRDALYGIDKLYDYLLTSIGPGLYAQSLGKRWAEIDTTISRLSDVTRLDVFLVKAIGLLGAVGQLRNIGATPEILQFAAAHLDSSPKIVESHLKELQRKSLIIYRRFNKTYSLWEGSDLDIDELVKIAASKVGASETIASLAGRYLHPRPIVARRHSFETGTLRFFSVHFAGSQVSPPSLGSDTTDADGKIMLVLPENAHAVACALKAAAGPPWRDDQLTLLGVLAEPSRLAGALRHYSLLLTAQDSTAELAGDATARRELRARITEARQRVEAGLAEILTPAAQQRHCRWFYRGKAISLPNQRALNEKLSAICDSVFSKTPRIKNELINRRELSSAAAKARRNLIEKMIESPNEPTLGIAGTPPEKSMYLTLLESTGIHRATRSGQPFGEPSPKADAGVREAWRAIRAFFVGAEKSPRSVAELFCLLQAPPFGMKEGPLPVIACAALLAHDSEVALYEDGTFIPQLRTAVFERLVKAPSRFTVQRWRITGIRSSVFDGVAELLSADAKKSGKATNRILSVVRPLCRLAASLNDYARYATTLSPAAREVRDVLLKASKPDQLLFVELPRACGTDPFPAKPVKGKKSVNQFITSLKAALRELQSCYERLLLETTTAFAVAFDAPDALHDLRQELTTRAKSLKGYIADAKLAGFVNRIGEDATDDHTWLESLAGLVALRAPSAWRAEDRERFQISLTAVARSFGRAEAIALSTDDTDGSDEAIRVGITRRSGRDVMHVVHLRDSDRPEIERMRGRIVEVLGAQALNGHAKLAIAALAEVTESLFEKQEGAPHG